MSKPYFTRMDMNGAILFSRGDDIIEVRFNRLTGGLEYYCCISDCPMIRIAENKSKRIECKECPVQELGEYNTVYFDEFLDEARKLGWVLQENGE